MLIPPSSESTVAPFIICRVCPLVHGPFNFFFFLRNCIVLVMSVINMGSYCLFACMYVCFSCVVNIYISYSIIIYLCIFSWKGLNPPELLIYYIIISFLSSCYMPPFTMSILHVAYKIALHLNECSIEILGRI
ncbi:hypothetical protein P175DRAFT_089800 [Aspergillus ochraceoroseus IBT 24754]|uniref:Uncharacterized protein n=1 Tax=Aspergillus ochraceoroseus IBT 24754 TaxID=1392256 RepID=A0A2T5LMD8_9EURO|nr:uncharacterized protein P175DRAFT_089800 [Aspergillus ochraceoroseus IBT 24754]PTU17450.1 hypothetical protein P175DRAFT_089800 [Aspergillus ochraceoroseus IBT 24754]